MREDHHVRIRRRQHRIPLQHDALLSHSQSLDDIADRAAVDGFATHRARDDSSHQGGIGYGADLRTNSGSRGGSNFCRGETIAEIFCCMAEEPVIMSKRRFLQSHRSAFGVRGSIGSNRGYQKIYRGHRLFQSQNTSSVSLARAFWDVHPESCPVRRECGGAMMCPMASQ